MRLALLTVLTLAACGGAAATAPDPAPVDNDQPAAPVLPPRADGRPVVELAPLATDVPDGAALDEPIRAAAADAFETEHTYATDGGRADYRLDIKLAALDVSGAGPMTVRCELSIMISTMPDRAIVGMVNSAASVEATPDQVDAAKADCSQAVIRNVVTAKVIPALQKRAAS